MKIGKMFSIDRELLDKDWKTDNLSELVNRLLWEYFHRIENPYEKMTIEQLEKEAKIEEIKEEMDKRIKEIRDGKQ